MAIKVRKDQLSMQANQAWITGPVFDCNRRPKRTGMLVDPITVVASSTGEEEDKASDECNGSCMTERREGEFCSRGLHLVGFNFSGFSAHLPVRQVAC